MTALDYILCERSLAHFTQSAWEVLEPNTPLLWNWHHDLIAEHLEAVNLGQIKRLIINVPPRDLKSTLSTICFPVWLWGPKDKPHKRFLFGSHSDSLAKKHSLFRRNLIYSPWFQYQWYRRFKLSDDQNVKTDYSNDRTGQMRSSGIMGGVTGEGADIIILDDPHDPLGAHSDTERENTLFAIDHTWSTRLNDKKNGAIIVVMQRLHEQDATGHLIQKGGWTHLCIKQEAEDFETHHFPMSGQTFQRQPGELLHPARNSQAEIDQVKVDLGEIGYASQHQQNPTPKTGTIIKLDWFKFYKELPDKLVDWTLSADFTFKDSAKSDMVVMQVWARHGANRYLIDQVRDRLGFVRCLEVLTEILGRYPQIEKKLIEDKANGPAIVNTVQGKIDGVIPFNPDKYGSKAARLEDCSVLFQGGNVFYPDPSICRNADLSDGGKPKTGPWIEINKREMLAFGKTKFDDTVDATTQYLIDSKEKIRDIRRLEALITL